MLVWGMLKYFNVPSVIKEKDYVKLLKTCHENQQFEILAFSTLVWTLTPGISFTCKQRCIS